MTITQIDPSAFYTKTEAYVHCGVTAARIFASWDRVVPYGAPFRTDIDFRAGHLYEARLGIALKETQPGAVPHVRPTRKVLQDRGLHVHRCDVTTEGELVVVFETRTDFKLKVQEQLFEFSAILSTYSEPIVLFSPAPVLPMVSIKSISTEAKAPAKRELTDDERDALLMKALDEDENTPPVTTSRIETDSGLAVNLTGARAQVRSVR